jgi:hypothetical protein
MRQRLLPFAIALVFPALLVRAAPPGPSALLTLSAPATQPANDPVLLTLTVYNTGYTSLGYWCGGPGDYPDVRDFQVSVHPLTPMPLDAGSLKLTNGQRSDGTGAMHWIAPGQTARVPAALAPLPVGKYRIIIQCEADGTHQDGILRTVTWPALQSARPLEIEIRDEPSLRDARRREILARVRSADPFAQYVAVVFPEPALHDAIAEDLASDNPIVVERAMDGLWGDGPPNQADAPRVFKAIDRHLRPPPGGIDFAMMERLLAAIGTDRSPAARELVAKVAAARPEGRVHQAAVSTLGKIGPKPWIVRTIPPPPPEQYDRDAIAALIKLAHSMGTQERKLAYMLLAEYPKSPEAVEAIRAGTADPDPDVRALAHQSLNRVTP